MQISKVEESGLCVNSLSKYGDGDGFWRCGIGPKIGKLRTHSPQAARREVGANGVGAMWRKLWLGQIRVLKTERDMGRLSFKTASPKLHK